MNLSKSDFLKYQICPSYPWLWKHKKEVVPVDEEEDISRVPQNVLLESITAIAQDRLASGEQVDLNALQQQLGQRLSSGSLNIEPANLEALAKRVQQNGFYESGGDIWQAQANPNTPQGRIAAEARSLVREIIADILANG